MSIKEQIGKWSNTRAFMIMFGLVCLGAAYLFFSLALDHGSLLDYAIAFLFVIIGLRETVAGLFRKRNR